MGDVYTLLCYRSVELSKAFDLRNLCYSKISVVVLLGYRIAGISPNQNKQNMPCAKYRQFFPTEKVRAIHYSFNHRRRYVFTFLAV